MTIKDGITNLSSVAVGSEPVNFTYKKGDETWTDAPKASYADNKVTWNLGDTVLENGVNYSVSFDIWPSQAAYDLIAELNNGTTSYASLTEAQKSQVEQKTNNGVTTYELKTNSSLTVSGKYGDTTIADTDVKDSSGNLPLGEMPLTGTSITVKKNWENNLDQTTQPESATLILNEDGKAVKSDITVGSGNNWTSDALYIAPGVMTVNGSTVSVLETGHDYTVSEDPESTYRWDLNADTYHPMVINGTLTMLNKVDSEPESGTKYQISSSWYVPTGDNTATITATNSRRSNLNLTKTVVDKDGKSTSAADDKLFTFNVTATVPDGSADYDKTLWFSVSKPGSGDNTEFASSSDGLSVTGDTVTPQTGDSEGYYTVTSGKTITVKMKPGWNLRFINIPKGTSYSVTETDIPTGYVFDTAALSGGSGEDTSLTVDTSAKSATGTIGSSNASYTVTITNKESTDVPSQPTTGVTQINVSKVWSNSDGTTTAPEGAEITVTAYDEDGNSAGSVTLDGTVDDNETTAWSGSITGLDADKTYTIKESGAPSGYTTSISKPTTSTELVQKTYNDLRSGRTYVFADSDNDVLAWNGGSGLTWTSATTSDGKVTAAPDTAKWFCQSYEYAGSTYFSLNNNGHYISIGTTGTAVVSDDGPTSSSSNRALNFYNDGEGTIGIRRNSSTHYYILERSGGSVSASSSQYTAYTPYEVTETASYTITNTQKSSGGGTSGTTEENPPTHVKSLSDKKTDSTYDLSLSVTGKEKTVTSGSSSGSQLVDVVIVGDMSISMHNNTDLGMTDDYGNALTRAEVIYYLLNYGKYGHSGTDSTDNGLIGTLFDNNNANVSYVSFSNSATVRMDWTTSKSSAISGISSAFTDSIATWGGETNVADGLSKAATQLESARSGSKKVVILFSDGEPNISTSGGTTEDEAAGKQAAYTQAEAMKDSVDEFYVVGITNGVGTEFLQTLLNKFDRGNYYTTTQYQQIQSAFSDIGSKVSTTTTTVPMTGVSITDTLSDDVEFATPNATNYGVTVSDGTNTVDADKYTVTVDGKRIVITFTDDTLFAKQENGMFKTITAKFPIKATEAAQEKANNAETDSITVKTNNKSNDNVKIDYSYGTEKHYSPYDEDPDITLDKESDTPLTGILYDHSSRIILILITAMAAVAGIGFYIRYRRRKYWLD